MSKYNRYKNAVSIIVDDALLNYITGGLANEVDFRMWLSERRFYYKNRIVNTIVPLKLTEKLNIISVVQEEVDKIIGEYNELKSKGISDNSVDVITNNYSNRISNTQ